MSITTVRQLTIKSEACPRDIEVTRLIGEVKKAIATQVCK